MKKGICALALLGLSALLPAQAMYINPQGTGQVLLFPYYTAQDGQTTLISVTNTKNTSKLMRISIHEANNAREVLDFWISLSPHDSWVGSIGGTGDKLPATLSTRDTTCTAPDKPDWDRPLPGGGWSVDMRPYAFIDDNNDSGPRLPARTREGYVEVIEMAELSGSLATAAVTRQCAVLTFIDPSSPDLLPPGGGLSGHFAIADVAAGTLLGGSATAIEDFSSFVLVNDLGVSATLQQGNSEPGVVFADIPVDGRTSRLAYSTVAPNNAIDAVSALLAADSLQADIASDAAAGSFTEWVVTLPTKPFYTDNQIVGVGLGDPGAISPFEETFGETHSGGSCSRFAASARDEEGRPIVLNPDPAAAPARSAAQALPPFSLCRVTNVLHFGDTLTAGATPLLHSRLGVKVWNPQPSFSAGRVQLDFSRRNDGTPRLLRPSMDSNLTLRGMPLIGFAAYKYTSDNVLPGSLSGQAYLLPLSDKRTVCTNAQGTAIACP